jgi:hypothetical protein
MNTPALHIRAVLDRIYLTKCKKFVQEVLKQVQRSANMSALARLLAEALRSWGQFVMGKGFRENLRPVIAALLFLSGLTGSVRASLIPAGTDILFSTNSYALYNNSGLHFMAPDNVFSSAGTLYLTNNQILKAYQPRRWFMSFGQGLDALALFNDPATGQPTTYFSTGRTFFSNTYNRNIGEGDLLNRDGTIVATNQDLLSKFTTGTAKDLGLDAADVVNPGANQEIWFSTRSGFHSDALSLDVGAGDLLSNTGELIATNAELLSAFAPSNPGTNYGLDAVHVISDEPGQTPVVLFSTGRNFYSTALKRTISQGDILSNTGEVVMANAQLMKNFGWHFPDNPGVDAIAFYPPAGATTIGRALPPVTSGNSPTVIPEPATLCLLALGSGIAYLSRKR